MTDEMKTPAEDVVVVAGQIADDRGVSPRASLPPRGIDALIVARFADTTSAIAIYDRLLAAEIDGSLEIDGVLVVKADEGGKMHVQKMTDHSTRKGLKWGIVGGVVAAVFLPATIIGGAVALGVAGAAAGKARNLYHRVEVEEELAGVITPGTSGILAPRLGAGRRGGREEDAGGPGGQDGPRRRGDRRRHQGRRGRRRQRDARRRLTPAPSDDRRGKEFGRAPDHPALGVAHLRVMVRPRRGPPGRR